VTPSSQAVMSPPRLSDDVNRDLVRVISHRDQVFRVASQDGPARVGGCDDQRVNRRPTTSPRSQPRRATGKVSRQIVRDLAGPERAVGPRVAPRVAGEALNEHGAGNQRRPQTLRTQCRDQRSCCPGTSRHPHRSFHTSTASNRWKGHTKVPEGLRAICSTTRPPVVSCTLAAVNGHGCAPAAESARSCRRGSRGTPARSRPGCSSRTDRQGRRVRRAAVRRTA
jgi:hypothetical protein